MRAAWDKANEAYRKSPGVEPAFQVEIKLQAFLSLNSTTPDSFSWKDYKRAHQMMKIWDVAGRLFHSYKVYKLKERANETPSMARFLSINSDMKYLEMSKLKSTVSEIAKTE